MRPCVAGCDQDADTDHTHNFTRVGVDLRNQDAPSFRIAPCGVEGCEKEAAGLYHVHPLVMASPIPEPDSYLRCALCEEDKRQLNRIENMLRRILGEPE